MSGIGGRSGRLFLLLLVVGGAAILTGRREPTPPDERPLLGLRGEEVVGIRLEEGSRTFRAVRSGAGWRIEEPASTRPGADGVASEMVDALVRLVPVDVFARDDVDRHTLGLDPPRARVTLARMEGAAPIVLLLGDFVPTGGSVYGALGGDPRIFLIGAMVVSDLERAFYLASEAPG